MPLVVQIFIAVVVISAVVGAIAQFLSKFNEPNPDRARRANADRPPAARGETVRQSAGDVDRFLAEIDRLRKRPAGGTAAGVPPMATPVRPPRERVVRPRTVEPVAPPPRRPQPVESPYTPPPSPILSPPTAGELPTAPVMSSVTSITTLPQPTTVVTVLPASLSAPVNPVTPRALPNRGRAAAPKTEFARTLTALLGSGQAAPMAIVLGEIFGPPKARG